MNDLVITYATQRDVPDLVRLVRRSLPVDIRDKTIYGCSGVTKFITAELAKDLVEHRYLVARHRSTVIGCAAWRIVPGNLTLNYLAVALRERGKGIGRRLFETSLDVLANNSPAEISLDVFAENQLALDWYTRLGFRITQETLWRKITQAQVGDTVTLSTIGLAAADAVHQRFGFSEFRIAASGRQFTVGRMGRRWFRLGEVDAIDPQVLTLLSFLDQRRQVLAVTGKSGHIPSGISALEVARAFHLRAAVSRVCRGRA